MKDNLLAIIRGDRSQEEMAKKYDVSQQAWWSWESGRTTPSSKVMFQMEKDFELPMEVIFFNAFNYKNK